MKRYGMLLAGLLLVGQVFAQTDNSRQPSPPAAAAEQERADVVAQAADAHARQTARKLAAGGARFLLSGQEESGGWAGESGPGVTCLVLKALIQEPTVGPRHPAVARGVAFVRQSLQPDGGLYATEGFYKNYETCVALSMFAALHDPEQAEVVAGLQGFLKKNQWDEDEGKSQDDAWYGGAGYGRHKRPDLSNTQFMVEALHDSGLPEDDPVYQKALVFISRCQMLGESNDQPLAKGSTQGGFIYTAANGGESKAGTVEEGSSELRCYGSMTYAGFKSMVYAGLKRDDPRVQAALEWIRQHWTLEHNPNMPLKQSEEGLYYYYHVFGRALDAFGEDNIKDARGEPRYWRHELVDKLASLQKSDGRWVNERDRWMEGLPALTTAYAMLALEAAYPEEAAASQPVAAPARDQ
ncbi:MAG: terpene cyclase/mutase family protein [Phycisphaerae bacterium]|jgi:squalene-hopene/tetraprenyl-beta-curcumene cyclase